MADPFPGLSEAPATAAAAAVPAAAPARAAARPDVDSEDAFPTLGGTGAPATRAASAWVSSVPVIQRVTHQATLSLHLAEEQLAKLSSVLQRVQQRCRNVTIEASTTRRTGSTTFIIKGPSDAGVQTAKRELSVQLARRVSLSVSVPASLRAYVIGSGGKNVKAITEKTGVRISIPPRADGAADAGDVDPLLDEQVVVAIDGDEVNATHAQQMLQAIIAERTSRATQRLTHIDPTYYPFLAARTDALAAAGAPADGAPADVAVNVLPHAADGRDAAVVVAGDRDAVARTVQAIDAHVAEMRARFRTLAINIPKRQHQLLAGDRAAHVLATTTCSIELPLADDPSESVTIRGPQPQLPRALAAAMEAANSVCIEALDLVAMHAPGRAPDVARTHARRLVLWLAHGARPPPVPGVQVHLPRAPALERGDAVIEVVGADAAQVAQVRREYEQVLSPVLPEFAREVDVDPLAHAFVIGKKGQGLKTYESRGVDVLLPPESSGRADVLMVLGRAPALAALPADLAPRLAAGLRVLDECAADLAATAAAAGDIRTEQFDVPARYHAAIIGRERTVLSAIIGEDRLLVTFGNGRGVRHGTDLTADSVVVRGGSDAVARAVARIQAIAKDAEEDAIVNGHVEQFTVPGAHVPHLIGRGGAAVSKLRDELGVKINFAEHEGRARSAPVAIVITGRKECVEEAKTRLAAQAQRLADETTVRIAVPHALHGALIGQGGKYVTRIQDKYDVRVNFPHAAEAGAGAAAGAAAGAEAGALRPDQVSIRGSKKGVAEAQAELLELLEYEKEHGHVAEVAVPARAVARILGRGGSTINQIRMDSHAQIDLDPREGRGTRDQATLRLRGSAASVDAARRAIGAIVARVESEATVHVAVAPRFHGALIGAGGANLRALIERVGGPADPKEQAQLVRFPRNGEAGDQVVVRATKDLAAALAAALEQEATALASRVVYGASVPPALHRQLMARGGTRHSEWQTKHGVHVILPKWREYDDAGAPQNADALVDADAATVVKLVGPPDAVPRVLEEIHPAAEAWGARMGERPVSGEPWCAQRAAQPRPASAPVDGRDLISWSTLIDDVVADTPLISLRADYARNRRRTISLCVLYASIFVLALALSLDSMSFYLYLNYACSEFNALSSFGTVTIVQQLVMAVSKPPIAKLSDTIGRVWTLFAILGMYAGGYAFMAAARSFPQLVLGAIVQSFGFTGVQVLQSVIIADTTSVQWRGLLIGTVNMPYLINFAFAGPLADHVLGQYGWRAGYALWVVVVPLAAVPLLGTLLVGHRRAQRCSMGPAGPAPRALDVVREMDLVGMALFSAGLTLVLLPLSLRGSHGTVWSMGNAEIVAGCLLFALFTLWETRTSTPFIPLEILSNGSVIVICIISALDFAGFYLSWTYLSAFVQVLCNWNQVGTAYFVSTQNVTSTVAGIFIGIGLAYMRRFKSLLIYGLVVRIAGVAMMVRYRAAGHAVVTLVMCQVLQGLGGGAIAVTTQVAAQIAVPQAKVALVTALQLLTTEVGAALGSTMASAVFTSLLPRELHAHLPFMPHTELERLQGDLHAVLAYPMGSAERIAITDAWVAVMRMLCAISVIVQIPALVLAFALPDTPLQTPTVHTNQRERRVPHF
ncbi:hypothetical protein MSPP1_003232, partial [Malassezia sp. CBS 17886]